MNILGIDPGPFESAYCLWDGQRILRCGKDVSSELSERVANGFACFESDVPDIIAVEHLQCFGMGVGKEVFDTAYWIGEFRRAAKTRDITYRAVTRIEVKTFFCHTARATDSNLRYALEDRFGKKGTKKAPGIMYPLVGTDMRSAFAIAVMVYDTLLHQDDL